MLSRVLFYPSANIERVSLGNVDMIGPFMYSARNAGLHTLEINNCTFNQVTSTWEWPIKLQNITGELTGWNIALDLSQCVNLTHDSLMNVINGLEDRTGQDALTLTLGTTNKDKLTDEEKAIATAKNWTLA